MGTLVTSNVAINKLQGYLFAKLLFYFVILADREGRIKTADLSKCSSQQVSCEKTLEVIKTAESFVGNAHGSSE